MEIYHFSRTRVPHQFCHRGTVEVEIGQLKKIMWYSSMVNSSTMQHNTRVYQARVPFYNKMLFKKKKIISKVLELTKLEYLVNFFFWDYRQININIKWCLFYL